MTTIEMPKVSSVSWMRLSPATCLLMTAIFSAAAAGFVMEFVIGTVSTYVLGSSHTQYAFVIGTMVFAMGIAQIWQGRISDNYLVEKFFAAELGLALLSGFSPLIIYATFAYMEEFFPIVLFMLSFSIGFLIGLEIPLALRINEKYVGELKANLQTILSMDFIGGFVGIMVYIFIMLPNIHITDISFIVAGFNFLAGVLLLGYFMWIGASSYPYYSLLAIVVTIGILAFGLTHNREWEIRIEQKLYDAPIIHSETTKYQHIVLTHDGALDDYRLYLNGGLQFSSVDEEIYHENLVHPAMALAPSRSRVLILGGGDGLALREVLKYKDVREVFLVDLDPRMIELARTHKELRALNGGSFDDARVHASASTAIGSGGARPVHMDTGEVGENGRPIKERVARVDIITVDAFKFIQDIGYGPWDVVLIDFPDPDQVELAKLYSREFYRLLQRSLAPDGVIAMQSTSPYHAKEAFLCIGRTLKAAGFGAVPYHANIPSFGDWGWYIARQDMSAAEVGSFLNASATPRVETKHLTSKLISASLAFGKEELTSEHDEVNSLMYPVLLQYYTKYAWQGE